MSQLSEVSFEILVHKTVLDFYGYHSFYSRPEHCMPLSTSMLWLCQRPLMKSRFKLELIYIMQFASFQAPSTFGKTSQRMSHWFFLQFCVESQYNFVFISKVTASFALFFFFFKHLCVHKRIQPLFRCVGIGVYKRCESANLERCQLTLRKKDKLMANVSFDQDMEFYISVYLLKSQLKLHLFVESRFLCSI